LPPLRTAAGAGVEHASPENSAGPVAMRAQADADITAVWRVQGTHPDRLG
jgi:hypothetical protein